MINRLFSSFDPSINSIKIRFVPLLIAVVFLWIGLQIYNLKSRGWLILSNIKTKLEEDLIARINNFNKKGKINLLRSLFFLILILNVIGLIPYIFTLTAHILISLSLRLPLWTGLVLFRLKNNTQHFLSHLVPLSTPMALSNFIVLVETVSQIIRPITLSVRLAANITAGHILIALCRSNIIIINTQSSILLVLLILETAVAFIQSYVFTVLISIYLSET